MNATPTGAVCPPYDIPLTGTAPDAPFDHRRRRVGLGPIFDRAPGGKNGVAEGSDRAVSADGVTHHPD